MSDLEEINVNELNEIVEKVKVIVEGLEGLRGRVEKFYKMSEKLPNCECRDIVRGYLTTLIGILNLCNKFIDGYVDYQEFVKVVNLVDIIEKLNNIVFQKLKENCRNRNDYTDYLDIVVSVFDNYDYVKKRIDEIFDIWTDIVFSSL